MAVSDAVIDEITDFPEKEIHRLMAYDFLCSYAFREADMVSL